MKPLAVQLYSLREYAEKDFVQVLKKVAEIGYKAVEPAGFFNLSPAEFKKIIDEANVVLLDHALDVLGSGDPVLLSRFPRYLHVAEMGVSTLGHKGKPVTEADLVDGNALAELFLCDGEKLFIALPHGAPRKGGQKKGEKQ